MVSVNTVSRGLLFAESEALKAKLSGLTVSSDRAQSGQQRVQVFYGWPSGERRKTYPFITIDFVSMRFAFERAHSAVYIPVDYWPSEYETFQEYADANGISSYTGTVGTAMAMMWHPYDLIFQVTTYARNPIHDLQITGKLVGTAFLPDRWGYLPVPADGSQRHLTRLGMTENNSLEGNNQTDDRVFSKVYTVAVTADVPPENPLVYAQVLHVAGTLSLLPSDPDSGPEATWSHDAPTP